MATLARHFAWRFVPSVTATVCSGRRAFLERRCDPTPVHSYSVVRTESSVLDLAARKILMQTRFGCPTVNRGEYGTRQKASMTSKQSKTLELFATAACLEVSHSIINLGRAACSDSSINFHMPFAILSFLLKVFLLRVAQPSVTLEWNKEEQRLDNVGESTYEKPASHPSRARREHGDTYFLTNPVYTKEYLQKVAPKHLPPVTVSSPKITHEQENSANCCSP